MSPDIERIAHLARTHPEREFISLNHLLTVELLWESWREINRSGAVGVDHVTASQYGKRLRANLTDLLERAKSGSYRALPVRRAYIPKGAGPETRPIGILTLEGKILQRAVTTILEAIYEQDFLDCSYGFRPGRNAHQALEAIWKQAMSMGGCWLLEVDIRKFFDTLNHAHLREFLQRRVRDGVLRRLVHKWLKAGVMEKGQLSYPDSGTPQGGVISPLLANLYLHEVLDKWFEHEVKPGLKGRAFLVRYADDFVIGFEREEDARRVHEMLPARFAAFDLTIHPTKTRLVDFRHPSRRSPPGSGPRSDGRTFSFLGFVHFWGKTRRGRMAIRRRTDAQRFKRAVGGVAAWARANRHRRVADQHRLLCAKVKGHYLYYGITGNTVALARFHRAVERLWQKWLNRRSQLHSMPWHRFQRLLRRYPLPRPRVYQSVYRPQQRALPFAEP